MSAISDCAFAVLIIYFLQSLSGSRVIHDALPFHSVDNFKSVQPLLQAFGRDLQKKIKVESWEELFHLNGSKLKTMDVTVKDRR